MDTFGILKRDLTSKTIQILDTKWILKWDPKRILKWIPKGVPLWSLFGSKKDTIFGIHFIPKWDPHGIHFGSIVLLGDKAYFEEKITIFQKKMYVDPTCFLILQFDS